MKKLFVSKLFLLLSPFVKWVNKTFTLDITVKKVTGVHYYKWRNTITEGMVFLSNINGAGSNLINPSEINHGSIYFGFGLKTYMRGLIDTSKDRELAVRLVGILKDKDIHDDVPYVIEAIGEGTVPTDLVTFLTTKDLVIGYKPNFCGAEKMKEASRASVKAFGLPYDYSFSHADDTKYCFEVVADAYEEVTEKMLKRVTYKFFGIKLIDVFLSETFQTTDWSQVFHSKEIKGH